MGVFAGMYIKQIQIQGFKSYRDQTAVSPFSPRHNVVVGRNGSGKSNFFSAIRFVLADQYATLSREERQALLHDSSSSNATTLSAFVELIFDNSDRRFPTNGDEVVLRRTIGLKKDEYSIDRRSASKADVANLLEAAGFSRANPYYIVPQGRITALTNAKDHERLDLLKEVAGTRVYEQRRAESLKIVDDTQAKRAKIADLLEYIEAKISDLDADRAELAEYYKADKERRSLEYTLYQADLTSVATALEKLEEERLRDTELAATDVDAFSVNARQIAQLAERQTELERSAEDAHLAHEQAEADHRALVKSLTNAQMLLAQIADGAEGRQVAASALHEQRITIQQEIEGKEAQLEALRPALRRAQQELAEQKDELEQARAQAGALRAKQARSSQFNSQPERDAYLVQQIEELASFVQSQQQRIAQTEQERAEAERKLAQDTASREEAVQQIESRKDQLETLTAQWRATRQARDEANEQKKDLWNEEVRLQSDQTFAREQLSAAERALSGTVDRATMSGLSAVERIARQLGLTEAQVHGPLYKLFTVDDRFKLPVEVVAGKSLFHVVVDTDDTAARIIEVMNRERSGRVTFMPLNRLHGRGDHVDFPQASDAVLMIRKIHFDDRYRLAMEQVFGKTIICPNLEIAGAYVRSNKVDAITLDGDRVERKGALSGGFHDPRASRMDAIRSYQRLQDTLAETTARLEQVRLQVAEREQEATQLISDMQRAETRRRQVTDSRGPLLEQIAYQRRQEEASAARVRTLTALEADQQTELRKSQATQLAFEEELQTPLAARLSGEEEALLASLGQRADELARLSTQSTSRASDLQAQLADLEIDLDEDLRRRRDELDARLESIAAESTGAPLGAPLDADPTDGEAAEQNVGSLERRVAERATSVAERAGTLDQMTEELRTLGERLETLKARQGELGRSVGRQQKGIERYLAKKHRLQEQRDKTNRSIRDLGVLPEEAFDARYAAMKPERVSCLPIFSFFSD